MLFICRSRNKNHRGLFLFLHSLNIDFDVIMLSEIWNYNLELYHNVFANYNFHFVVSETSSVGGVRIFVKNTFVVHVLDHLQMLATGDSMIKNLWLEIDTGNRNYIVAGFYSHPNQNNDSLIIYWTTVFL